MSIKKLFNKKYLNRVINICDSFIGYLQQIKPNFLLKFINIFLSYLKIFTLFCLIWTIFSGNSDKFLVVCGIISVILSFIFCLKMKVISYKSYIVKLSFFKYIYFLLRDIIKSTIDVVKVIYSKNSHIAPSIIAININKLTEQEKILFSNLITMTPGTFVIAVDNDNYLIHALNKDDFENKDNKEILDLLNKMRNDKI